MSEERAQARTWVHRKPLDDDAWVIECRLCGKHFRRVFRTDKHEDTARAAAEYVGSHLDSAAHLAAVAAYREMPHETLTKEEMLLRAIFGERTDERTDEQKRMAAARNAALGKLNQ